MTSRGSNEFWLNSDISIKAHTYYSDGRLVMIIKNSKTYEITIVKAIINDHTYTLNQKLVPGEQRTVTLLTDACNTGTNYILNIKFYFYDDDDRSRGLLSFGPDIPLTGICEEISEEWIFYYTGVYNIPDIRPHMMNESAGLCTSWWFGFYWFLGWFDLFDLVLFGLGWVGDWVLVGWIDLFDWLALFFGLVFGLIWLIWVDFGLDDWFARNQKKRIKIHNVYFVTQYYTNLILTVVELSDAISILYLPGAYNVPISLTTL